VGDYNFKGMKEAMVDMETLATFHFEEEISRKCDPLNVIIKHCRTYKYRWLYQNELWKEEELYRRALSLDVQ
jgi:hypothetical protein